MQKNKKRILVIGMTSNPGGAENFVFERFKLLHSQADFYFTCFESKIMFEKQIKELNGKIIYFNIRRTKNIFGFNKGIKSFFRNNHFDIVWLHVCTAGNVIFLKHAKQNGSFKRIIHSHISYFQNTGFYGLLSRMNHYLWKRSIIKYATDFWACSEKAGKFMFDKKIRNTEKYRVITNAVDTKRFVFNGSARLHLRQEWGFENNFIIGHIGRFTPQKNHVFLIKIFAELAIIDENARLILVGVGEKINEIMDLVNKFSLADKVLFLGYRDDIPALLSAFDSFLLPSLFEGLPLVLVEAQSTGLVVLYSDKITEEVNLTDLCVCISLKKHPAFWAEWVIETKNRFANREDYADYVEKKGFSLEKQSRKLARLLFADEESS